MARRTFNYDAAEYLDLSFRIGFSTVCCACLLDFRSQFRVFLFHFYEAGFYLAVVYVVCEEFFVGFYGLDYAA